MIKIDGIEYESIGHDVFISYFCTTNILKAGLIERHKNLNSGEWCEGSLSFVGTPGNGPRWTVDKWAPLTISPSVLCSVCGHHGWIKEGRWVPA